MPPYAALDSKAGNILRVGYCHQKPWQFAASHSLDNPKISAMGTVTDAMLDATPTIRYGAHGLTVEAKAASLGGASVNASYQFPKTCDKMEKCEKVLGEILKGVKVGARLERKYMKGVPTDISEVNVECTKNMWHCRSTLNPATLAWGVSKSLTVDKLPGSSSVVFGGELSGQGVKDLPSSLKYSIGAGYNRGGTRPWAATVKLAPNGKMPIGRITGTLYAEADKGHALAAEVVHDVSEAKTNVTLGGLVYLSPTKETSLKAKISPDAQIATVFTHKFTDNLTGSFGCQFSGAKQDAESLQYGMKFSMTA